MPCFPEAGLTESLLCFGRSCCGVVQRNVFRQQSDTFYVNLSDKEGLLRWKSGTWNTEELEYLLEPDGTPSAYADGQTDISPMAMAWIKM